MTQDRQPDRSLAVVTDIVYNLRSAFESRRVSKDQNFDAEAGFAVQAMQSNPYLLATARANPDSVRSAVVNVAAIGLTLNPARKEAYLVPRRVGDEMRVVLDISYVGLTKLATDSGSILWAQAHIVHQNDTFRLMSEGECPMHQRDPFDKNRGDIVGAYAVAKTKDGSFLVESMDIATINEIRDRAEAYKAYKAGKIKTTPWADPVAYPEMVRKTVIKRASKMWPKTPQLDEAIRYLDNDGDEGMSISVADANEAVFNGIVSQDTDEKALKYWLENRELFKHSPRDYERFKQAVAEHRRSLASQKPEVQP